MITTQTVELLDKLVRGILDPSITAMLEQTPASEWVDELRSVYRFSFQERHLGNKWELSLAKSLRWELAAHSSPESLFVSLHGIPVYKDCLMLSVEDNFITGISRLRRLAMRAVKKPVPGVALTTGKGYKIDKTPDGWSIKPMQKKTVKLTESFLQQRGWRFDHLNQFLPTV